MPKLLKKLLQKLSACTIFAPCYKCNAEKEVLFEKKDPNLLAQIRVGN